MTLLGGISPKKMSVTSGRHDYDMSSRPLVHCRLWLVTEAYFLLPILDTLKEAVGRCLHFAHTHTFPSRLVYIGRGIFFKVSVVGTQLNQDTYFLGSKRFQVWFWRRAPSCLCLVLPGFPPKLHFIILVGFVFSVELLSSS